MCETCAFATAAGRLCPDCMTQGSPGQRRASVMQSVVSLLCAAGVVLCVIVLVGIVGDASNRASASPLAMVLLFVGMTTGLLGRDHGRKTGSPLSLIAVIANSVLLGIYGLLIVVGLMARN
jgi:hypothetical protein